MRGRDGRPHAQRTGESFYQKKQQQPPPKPKPKDEPFWRVAQKSPQMEEFFRMQGQKQERQVAKAETQIFRNCVFYFLGFTGRGKDSRYNMVHVIERNGGRSVMMLTGQVTHVLTRGVCHRRKQLLARWVESHKIAVVLPEYVEQCIRAGHLLPADNFQAVRWATNGIEKYLSGGKLSFDDAANSEDPASTI
jgi:hypothetical protein